MVLHCSLDEEMVGLVEIFALPENKNDAKNVDILLARNLNDLKIHLDDKGNLIVQEQGAGVSAFAGPDLKWHYAKQYGPLLYNDFCGLLLAWSHNGFATFALDLLCRLEGKAPKRAREYMFGQVFDAIQPLPTESAS